MASSKLAEMLLRQWDVAASADVMHTNVNDTRRRCIPGSLGLVVQYNPSHRKKKRPVDSQLLRLNSTTGETLKASGFNFTLAKRSEFLSGLRFRMIDDDHSLPSVELLDLQGVSNDEFEHVVLVNVAPLVWGHLLFVFEINSIKPQQMTKKFMFYALGISQTIQREDFALGFNSAGAWSSVNHFHLQGYFFPKLEGLASVNFPITTQQRTELFRHGGTIVSQLPDWKTTCYVLEPQISTTNGIEMVEIAWILLEILQLQKIPHNLLIVKTTVFIFPRQPQCENGANLFSATDGASDSAGRLRIAVTELSGLVVSGDEMVYEKLTEEKFNAILEKELALSPSEEVALTEAWKKRIL